MAPAVAAGVVPPGVNATQLTIPKKKPISYSNLLLGAGLNMFEYGLFSGWKIDG
jgi:hypothetical protein